MTEARLRRTGPSPSHLLPASQLASARGCSAATAPRAQPTFAFLRHPYPGAAWRRLHSGESLSPHSPPQLPSRAGPLFETTPPGPAGTGFGDRRWPCWGTTTPRTPGRRSWGWGRKRRGRGGRQLHARAWVLMGEGRARRRRVGGVSRVRPAREPACGCACPTADWPARAVRVRARCQARAVGSRSAWCLRGWCARAADAPDWPAGRGAGSAPRCLVTAAGGRAGERRPSLFQSRSFPACAQVEP